MLQKHNIENIMAGVENAEYRVSTLFPKTNVNVLNIILSAVFVHLTQLL